jgi:hypothetical protein
MNNFSRLFLAATARPGFVGFWRRYAPDDYFYATGVNYGGTVTVCQAVPASAFNDSRRKPPLSDEECWPIFLCHLRNR